MYPTVGTAFVVVVAGVIVGLLAALSLKLTSYPKGYRVPFDGVYSCNHRRCHWDSWYARNVNPWTGHGERLRVRTAYVYPGACFKEG